MDSVFKILDLTSKIENWRKVFMGLIENYGYRGTFYRAVVVVVFIVLLIELKNRFDWSAQWRSYGGTLGEHWGNIGGTMFPQKLWACSFIIVTT